MRTNRLHELTTKEKKALEPIFYKHGMAGVGSMMRTLAEISPNIMHKREVCFEFSKSLLEKEREKRLRKFDKKKKRN